MLSVLLWLGIGLVVGGCVAGAAVFWWLSQKHQRETQQLQQTLTEQHAQKMQSLTSDSLRLPIVSEELEKVRAESACFRKELEDVRIAYAKTSTLLDEARQMHADVQQSLQEKAERDQQLLVTTFENLSHKVLNSQMEQFSQTTKEKEAAHQASISQLLKPLSEQLKKGEEKIEAEKLINDSLLLEKIGCFGIVLEKIPAKLAEKIASKLNIPVIGIGAGKNVDGQVLVVNDMLGMNKEFSPRFLRRYADLDSLIDKAVKNYSDDVKRGDFPNNNEQY